MSWWFTFRLAHPTDSQTHQCPWKMAKSILYRNFVSSYLFFFIFFFMHPLSLSKRSSFGIVLKRFSRPFLDSRKDDTGGTRHSDVWKCKIYKKRGAIHTEMIPASRLEETFAHEKKPTTSSRQGGADKTVSLPNEFVWKYLYLRRDQTIAIVSFNFI